MKYIFVINPASGGGQKHLDLEKKIKETCSLKNVNFLIYKTKKAGDATDFVSSLASSHSEPLRIYACGGDGTLNEVISGAPLSPNVAFGLIPHGTGNDFHRNFTHKDAFFDISRQINGDIQKIDLFRCNERYGINMINIGFDCDVVRETSRMKSNYPLPRKLTYIAGLARVFFRKFGARFKLTFDDGTVYDDNFTLALIANGRFCGGGFKTAPLAHLSSGFLDVCMIEKIPRSRFLSAVLPYKKGKHLEEKYSFDFIKYLQTTFLTVQFPTTTPYCIDGQIAFADNLKIEVCPQALSFILPQGCSEIPPSTSSKEERI